MAQVKYFQAVRDGLANAMREDPDTILFGEDVAQPGGIFAQTRGLQDEFGAQRVFDTPAGETGFMGAAVGAALTGLRPIVEISFADFFPACMDQVVNQMAKIRYMSGGQAALPVTVLSFGGGGLNAGPQHSGMYDAWLGSLPGIKTVAPASSDDVAGLIRTAVRDPDPVFVLMHKGLLQSRAEIPEDGPELVPLGRARIRRAGTDITIVCWSGSVRPCLTAADELAGSGIEAEVVDLRSIQPLDLDTILDSVVKTGRLLAVSEVTGFCGVTAEVVAAVTRDAFDFLDAPPDRVTAPFTPVPMSPPLERFVIPDAGDVVAAARRLVTR